jgi:hypothetical protein
MNCKGHHLSTAASPQPTTTTRDQQILINNSSIFFRLVNVYPRCICKLRTLVDLLVDEPWFLDGLIPNNGSNLGLGLELANLEYEYQSHGEPLSFWI